MAGRCVQGPPPSAWAGGCGQDPSLLASHREAGTTRRACQKMPGPLPMLPSPELGGGGRGQGPGICILTSSLGIQMHTFGDVVLLRGLHRF